MSGRLASCRSDDLRVGLAGLGRFGKLHAAILNDLPGARLAAICDSVQDEVATAAAKYRVAGCFTDYERMLTEAELDAVVLATPEPSHAEMALRAIEHGVPVFLEKPLATDYEQGRRVAEAATRAGVLLQVGLLLRFDVQHAYLKSELVAGRFGRLVSLKAKRNSSRAWFGAYADRAHPVYEASIHDIDLLLWYVASPCTRVYAVQRFLSGRRFPDLCVAMLQFADGTIASVETSWFAPDGAPANVLVEGWDGTIDATLEVVGTEQSACFRLLDSGLSIWTPRRTVQLQAAYWPQLHGHVVGALREEVAHFVECLRTGNPSPVASLDDAVEGLRIADAIIASAKAGTEVHLAA